MDEGVTPDLDILDTYVKATYPDLRKWLTEQINQMNPKMVHWQYNTDL